MGAKTPLKSLIEVSTLSDRSTHPGHGFFQRRYQHLREQSIVVLREAQARGEMRSDLPAEDLVIMLFAMMDGLQVQWPYQPEQISMAPLFEQFLRFARGK